LFCLCQNALVLLPPKVKGKTIPTCKNRYLSEKMSYNLDTTPSTNDYLKQLCDKQAVLDGTVVYTSNQTAGRGQQGNTWHMEQNTGRSCVILFFEAQFFADREAILSQHGGIACSERVL
jgi:hypothetical protein